MKRLALVLFLGALYLPGLGSSSSGTHPDESYYLGISAEMDARGDWLTPTLDGAPKWFKPPLLYWGERLAYAAFGRGFFGGRLPAALAAIALALLTGRLARRLYGEPAELPAALLTGTTFGWLKFGRIAMMDAPMALAFTLAAWGAWRASEEEDPPQLLWVGLGAGASFLLKGPVGAVLVLLIAGGFLALRRPRLLATRWTLGAFLLGAAVGLPWYVVSLAVHGRRFFDFFVIEQNVDRFRHAWTVHGELVLVVGWLVLLLPWTAVALAALPRASRWREPQLLLPMVWIASVFLVFTIPSLKWPHYGLACAPAVAMLAARRSPPAWARVATALFLAALALLAVAVLRWRLPAPATASLLGAAVALGVAAAVVLRGTLTATAASAGTGFALVLAFAIPAANPPVIPRAALAALRGRDVYVYDYVPGIFTLGAGRAIHRVERDAIEPTLERGGVVILTGGAAGKLPASLRGRLQAVASWEHIPGDLRPSTVVEAWRRADVRPLFEPMMAVEIERTPGAG